MSLTSLWAQAWIGNFAGELFSSQGHLGAALAGASPEFRFLPAMRVEGACASGGLAFASAVEAIQAGTDVALVCGAEVQNTVSAREGGDYLARASHYRSQRQLDDFTFPALFAQRMKHYCKTHNVGPKDFARVSVKAYANANKNPLAHMHAVKMDLDTASTASDKNPNFLANEDLKPHLRTSDCSQVSDGASAMVVVSEEGLRRLGKSPRDAIEVLAVQVAADNLYVDRDYDKFETTHAAAQRAFQSTGLTAKDFGVFEVHDCFSIAEVLMYEALGLADHGKGTHFAADGHTHIDGKFPVNTGGGLIGFGHPVGATGVKQVLEIFRQMKGQSGAYQIPNHESKLKLGLAANMGGSDKTAVVSLFANH